MAKKTKKVPTNTTGGLFDFFKHGVSLPKLQEGKYTAQIIKYELVKPEKIDGKPYIKFELQLADRVIVDNRFDKGFPIMIEQLKRQLNIENQEVVVQAFFDGLIKDKTTIDIWVSYVEVEGKGVFRNINYEAPRVLAQFDIEGESTNIEEDTDDELDSEI